MRRIDRHRRQQRIDLVLVEVQRVRALRGRRGRASSADECSPRAAQAAACRSSTRTAPRQTRAAPRPAGPAAAAESARPRRRAAAALNPSSICCSRLATRISMNSSRLLAVIARYFTRSSSGLRRVLRLFQHPPVEEHPRLVAAEEEAHLGLQSCTFFAAAFEASRLPCARPACAAPLGFAPADFVPDLLRLSHTGIIETIARTA